MTARDGLTESDLSSRYLWWMLALSLLPVVYIWLLRRRDKSALRYSGPEVIPKASRHSW